MTPLRQRMIKDKKVRNLALNTQRAYLEQVSPVFALFQKSFLNSYGPDDIRSYQVYLDSRKDVVAQLHRDRGCSIALCLTGYP